MNAGVTATSLMRTATDWQTAGLDNAYNLSDGHARYLFPVDIRESLTAQFIPALFGTDKRTQEDFEHGFAAEFYRLAGQTTAPDGNLTFHYSASVTIDCAARAMVANGIRRLGLITPTFDNIPLLLRRSGIELVSLAEDRFWADAGYRRTQLADCDALFLILPNNPTGFEPDRDLLLEVVGEAASTGRRLIVDSSFRFYSQLHTWDQYAALASHWPGLSAMFIEDTGKTWATAELKVGFAYTTGSLRAPMREVTNEVMLSVSPATFGLLTELISMSAGPADVLGVQVVARNRRTLREVLTDLPVEVVRPGSTSSVEWLRLTTDTGVAACTWMEARGLSVLPGKPFAWHDGTDDGHIRVGLSRSTEYFAGAADRLRDLLRERSGGVAR